MAVSMKSIFQQYILLGRKPPSPLFSAVSKLPVSCRDINQGSYAVIAIAKRKGTFQLNISEEFVLVCFTDRKKEFAHIQSQSFILIPAVFVIFCGEYVCTLL